MSNSYHQGPHALEKIRELFAGPEHSRSAYWDAEMQRISIDAAEGIGTDNVLAQVDKRGGFVRRLAHEILQTPFRALAARFRHGAQSIDVGKRIADALGRQYSLDMLRQSLSLALIRQHLDLADPRLVCVIGDGAGVMGLHFLLAASKTRVIFVNLAKPLYLDLDATAQIVGIDAVAFVSDAKALHDALGNEDIRAIAIHADAAALIRSAPISIAVNIVSMQEMTPDVISAYFDHIRGSANGPVAFYCCNRVEKTLPDGTVTRFHDYPWVSSDRFLVDEACPWTRWIYSTRPPFYRRRRAGGYAVWHRLAMLASTEAGA